jgi:hypothetical protein
MLASKIWTYIRIAVLIVLPSAAILPWLLLLTQGARDRKFLSNVNIQAVAQITDDMKVSELANRVTAYSSTVLLVVLALAAGVLALWSIWKSGLQSGAKAWPPWHWSPVLQVWLV